MASPASLTANALRRAMTLPPRYSLATTLSSLPSSSFVLSACASSSPTSFVASSRRMLSTRVAASSSRPAPLRTHAVSLYRGNYTDDDDELFTDDESGASQITSSYPFPRITDRAAVPDRDEEETSWLYSGTSESRAALASHRADEVRRKRWIANSRPPVRTVEIDARGRSYGRGSRKAAQARVWIQPGDGEIVVNRRDFSAYFARESDREHVLGPFVATRTCGKFDVVAVTNGGGSTGQAGAIRLGLARALEKYDPEYRPSMKRQGFMTRDPRKVERKKIGLVKARKAPQWVRR